MKNRISIVMFAVLVIFMISTGANAAIKDPFFDWYHKTDQKISKLREYFFISKTQISDEELKTYYRIKKNTLFADSQILMIENAKLTESWLAGTTTPGALEAEVVTELYSDFNERALFDLLSIYADALSASPYVNSYLAFVSPALLVVEGVQSVNNIRKLVNAGLKSMTDFAFRNMVFELYPLYSQIRDSGVVDRSELYDRVFLAPNSIYESDLKFIYEDTFVAPWAEAPGWSRDLVYEAILAKVEGLYLLRSPIQREHIGTTILWQAKQDGAFMPLKVSFQSSTVEQNQSVLVNGSGLTKKGMVYYSISFDGQVLTTATIEASLLGGFDLTIPTNCDTQAGQYVLEVTDVQTGKSATLPYTVIPSLSCDFTPPQLLSSTPSNGQSNVDQNLNQVCFKFNEPMANGSNIQFLGVPAGTISSSGTWSTSQDVCFQILSALPLSTEITWLLNHDGTISDRFADLAGNALPPISGVFTTVMVYSLSGRVTFNGVGVQDVSVDLQINGVTSNNTLTDSNGNYQFNQLPTGNYTVIPSKLNYTFTPGSQIVTVSDSNISGLDFVASLLPSTGTLRVPSEYSAIQTAIDAAQDGNTVLVADGTYTGEGNRNIDFKGKKIILRSENGPEKTIIDCQEGGTGFYLHSGESSPAEISGFTIENGLAENGGAIYSSGVSLTISNCKFINNKTSGAGYYGGAIYATERSGLSIANCSFSGNTAYIGGAIAIRNSWVSVNNSSFNANTAPRGSGGAIYNEFGSAVYVTGCIFSSNTAYEEGGAILVNSYANIADSSFIGNKAGYSWWGYGNMSGGGAIYCNVQAGKGWTPIIRNSLFYDNDANSMAGGALFVTGDSAIVENCIFSGNRARYGGAFFTSNTNWAIYSQFANSIFRDNVASSMGGAMAISGYSYVSVVNSVVWGNASPTGQFNGGSPSFTVTYSDIDGGFSGQGNINSDPLFVDPWNRDFRLTGSSPCIDTGTSQGAPAADITGFLRPQGNGFDMGAYEYH